MSHRLHRRARPLGLSNPALIRPTLRSPQVTRQFARMGSKFQKAAPVSAKVDTTVQSAYTALATVRRACLRRIFGDRVIGFWSSPERHVAIFAVSIPTPRGLEPLDPARPHDRAVDAAVDHPLTLRFPFSVRSLLLRHPRQVWSRAHAHRQEGEQRLDRLLSHIRNKKLQGVNLQYKRVYWPEKQRYVRLRISTKALKTINKAGLEKMRAVRADPRPRVPGVHRRGSRPQGVARGERRPAHEEEQARAHR